MLTLLEIIASSVPLIRPSPCQKQQLVVEIFFLKKEPDITIILIIAKLVVMVVSVARSQLPKKPLILKIDWQSHYYQMRKLLPCSQEILLARMVQMMFGYQNRRNILNLIKILKQDLFTAPTAHSLYQLDRVDPGGVSMPIMICGSQNDGIVDRPALERWSDYLKEGDLLWVNSEGHHFFHYFFPEQTGRQVIKFWQGVEEFIENKSLPLEDSSLLKTTIL